MKKVQIKVNDNGSYRVTGEVEDDREVATDHGSIYVEKSKEVFLDEEVIIDYYEKANCFQLKSKSEYLNPRMSFFDKTKDK